MNFTITEQNAQISLPVLNDGEIEGEETATFTIEAGEGYEVDEEANSGTFTIVDTVGEPFPGIKPVVSFSTEPELLIESQETVSLLNFSLLIHPSLCNVFLYHLLNLISFLNLILFV